MARGYDWGLMMPEPIPWPRAILNLTVFVVVVIGIMIGIVYLVAPSLIPGTKAYSNRIAREAAIAARNEKEDAAFVEIIKAQLACQKAVRARTKFPTKATFDPGILNLPQVGRLKNDPSTIGIRGHVELMNGIGAMIPHRYGCDINNGKIVKVFIEPG